MSSTPVLFLRVISLVIREESFPSTVISYKYLIQNIVYEL